MSSVSIESRTEDTGQEVPSSLTYEKEVAGFQAGLKNEAPKWISQLLGDQANQAYWKSGREVGGWREHFFVELLRHH